MHRSPKGSHKKLESQKQLIDEINHRMRVDYCMMHIGKVLLKSEDGIMAMMRIVRSTGQPLVDDWNCLKTLVSSSCLICFISLFGFSCFSIEKKMKK